MKALFRNDLYLYGRYYGIVTVIVFAITGGFVMAAGTDPEGSEYHYIISGLFGIIIMGMMPLGICSFNERSGWNKYCMTLSITRKQYVSEKYLMTLIIVLVYVLFTALPVFADMYSKADFDIHTYIKVLAVVAAAGLFCPIVVLPVTFGFNAKAGLTVFFIMCFFPNLMIRGILSGYYDAMSESGDEFYKLFPAVIVLAALLLYALSWLLSVHLYEKKEL